MTIEIQFYILSKDRPEYLRKTIESVLPSISNSVELIVSDNSTEGDVEQLIKSKFPSVTYIKRNGLPATDHFNKIISEASADFLVMFHDDDIVSPEYIQKLASVLRSNQSAVAVACNANIINGDGVPTRTYFNKLIGERIISSPQSLVSQYLCIFTGAHPAFPVYMYRTSKIKECQLSYERGGKHSDLSFLISVCNAGPLIWLSDILASYRVHAHSDSSSESRANRKNLINFLINSKIIDRKNIDLLEYKVYSEIRWHLSILKNNKKICLRNTFQKAAFGTTKRTIGLILQRPKVLLALVKKGFRKL